MRYLKNNQAGFTLVELLVTLAITGVMMTAVYAIYIANIKAVRVEENKVEMQQGQRISIDFIARELRSAAYDRAESDLPSIVDARSNFIYFTSDRNADGDIADPTEHIAFCRYNSGADGLVLGYSTGSTNAVGAVGTPVASGALALAHGHAAAAGFAGHQPFVPIQELEFFYTLANGTTTLNPTVGQMDDIRSVEVTILARVEAVDRNYFSADTYNTPGSLAGLQPAWGPYPADGVRRRLISAEIRFRNMGLE